MKPHFAWLPLLLFSLVACRTSNPPTATAAATPQAAALDLLRLAGEPAPDPDALVARFGTIDETAMGGLLDALASIGPTDGAQVRHSESLEPLPGFAVDLQADANGSLAHYSVQLEQDEHGAWIVRWFRGPGIDWPRAARSRGTGLRTSHIAGS